jgi:HPt (histidine-containing phosphotransfer) domain-containing protein
MGSAPEAAAETDDWSSRVSATLPDEGGPLLDPAQVAMLRTLRAGALLPKLMATFRDQATRDVAALTAAAAASDFTAVRSLAHGLKSASLNVGARRLGERAAELEAMVRSGAVADVPRLVSAVTAEFDRCRPEIEALT